MVVKSKTGVQFNYAAITRPLNPAPELYLGPKPPINSEIGESCPCRRTVAEVEAWEMSFGSTTFSGRAAAAAAMVPILNGPQQMSSTDCIVSLVTHKLISCRKKVLLIKPERFEVVCVCAFVLATA